MTITHTTWNADYSKDPIIGSSEKIPAQLHPRPFDIIDNNPKTTASLMGGKRRKKTLRKKNRKSRSMKRLRKYKTRRLK
jgi:hypothetical protein